MKEIKISSLNGVQDAAKEFASLMGKNKVFAFHGDMGAGKTTFISALARELGVEDDIAVNSPSFSIINEYRSSVTAELIYHFDLYRLEDMNEAMDIGVEDYLESGALCLIEWPDIIEPLLPYETIDVDIKVDPDNGTRTLLIHDN